MKIIIKQIPCDKMIDEIAIRSIQTCCEKMGKYVNRSRIEPLINISQSKFVFRTSEINHCPYCGEKIEIS